MSATLKIALAALVFSAIAPAALADTKPEQRSFQVAYDDLDMSALAGGKTLLGRIEKAARRVCGSAAGQMPIVQRMNAECRREVVARSVDSLGMTTLTLAWSGQYPAMILASR